MELLFTKKKDSSLEQFTYISDLLEIGESLHLMPFTTRINSSVIINNNGEYLPNDIRHNVMLQLIGLMALTSEGCLEISIQATDRSPQTDITY